MGHHRGAVCQIGAKPDRDSDDCMEMTERTQQDTACQHGSHTFFSSNHTWAEFSSSNVLQRRKKKKKKSRKNHCFLKTSAKSQCEKVQVTENMRFPENKLVITRTGKQALLPASSLEHPDAVLCWGQAFTGAGAGPSPGPPELVPFAQ